jgi:hypothetical protein
MPGDGISKTRVRRPLLGDRIDVPQTRFWIAPDAPVRVVAQGRNWREHEYSGMLRDAAFGKQDRGQNGA